MGAKYRGGRCTEGQLWAAVEHGTRQSLPCVMVMAVSHRERRQKGSLTGSDWLGPPVRLHSHNVIAMVLMFSVTCNGRSSGRALDQAQASSLHMISNLGHKVKWIMSLSIEKVSQKVITQAVNIAMM